MFDKDTIKQLDLIGYPKAVDPALAAIPEGAGMVLTDYHALLTLENLYKSAPQFSQVSDFQNWLDGKLQSSAVKAVSRLVTTKANKEVTKSLLERTRVYNGVGNIGDKIVKAGRFVGFRIYSPHQIKIVISQIGVQFDTLQSLKIYLFHSSQVEPVAEPTVNIQKAVSLEWITEEFNLNNQTLDGGEFYLGYYEDDLSGQAINREVDLSTLPSCASCNRQDYSYRSAWKKYLKIDTISATYTTKGELFEVEDVTEHYDTNWGLNLQMSAYCDLTHVIQDQKELLTDLVGYQTAADLLEEIAYSTRDNHSKEIQAKAKVALDEKENQFNVKAQLKQKLKEADFNLSQLDKVCLPCNKPNRIRYGAV